MVTPEPPASGDAIAVLKAIVAEVAGAGQPFSTDSYLPPHLVHDAREAITGAEDINAGLRKSVREYAAHEEFLLAMLAKANAIITELRAANSDLATAAIRRPNPVHQGECDA